MNFAMLFPGQGSHYTGMGKDLFENYPEARLVFEEASDLLGMNIKSICFNENDLLTKTSYAQPAIVTVSLAAYQAFMSEIGVKPTIFAGHSLGEYSALITSGTLKLGEGLKLVKLRGALMQRVSENSDGRMISVSHSKLDDLKWICNSLKDEGLFAVISCYNSTSQYTISGEREAIDKVIQSLSHFNIKYTTLKVSGAFHSLLMQEVANKITRTIQEINFGSGLDVISNLDGLPYSCPEDVKRGLILQITHPVQWWDTMKYIKGDNITKAIEIGPKAVLKNLWNQLNGQNHAISITNSNDIHRSRKWIKDIGRNKDEVYTTVLSSTVV
ncbi:malonyl CoA-acyl carrier protein transacylase [Bacillus anthracis]|nr:malonyl CoA-acyl carrier protein transacylase [Bacillus anthracis]